MRKKPMLLPDADKRGMRAAQYVRMSTDHQQYSTLNQADAIAAYAAQRGLTIVKTYEDEGCSGLNIDGREGLQRLIEDVKSGRAEFEFVLVYDISRWGRFQDADEGAYYEFICRESGIQVLYCAEQFENDGSLSSTILKNLKRAMAGEFSRELSVKVFIGQSRVTRMGLWRGGPPGYGLRRQLIDERGRVKAQLEYGQHKCLQADRTVLVHGPSVEVATVRRMFGSFVTEGKCPSEIAAELNADQIRTVRGRRWGGITVRQILVNEKYTGCIIFNRSSYKLKQKRVANPADMWIRHDNAFPPLVAPETFAKAQEIMRLREQQRSDQEALERLAAVGREKGYLTRAIIGASQDVLSGETYRRRFGSLVAAYKLAGYQPAPRQRCRQAAAKARSLLGELKMEIVASIEKLGGRATIEQDTGLLRINDEFHLSLGAALAISSGVGRQVRWTVHANRNAQSDLTLVVRTDASNAATVAYYLLPTADIAQARVKHLRISNRIFAEACRYDNLDALCRTCVCFDERGAA
jgi:DNA invertase Pin-like site-specific DNA recombinase